MLFRSTEAQTKAENYARERAFQMQAPGIVMMGETKPVELLQSVPASMYSGVMPAAEVIKALAGNGQVINPNTYYKPGVGDYLMQGIGTGAAAAGAGLM